MAKSVETITPDEHSSVVGGSTAARRINCPRSYALEQLVPPDGGSSYAREGTALHEMIAIVLDKDKKPDELLPFTFTHEAKSDDDPEGTWSFTVDEDLWYEIGQPALDAFDDFMDEIERDEDADFEYVIETRCAMPSIEGAFGTSDVIWKCGKLSGVWDWKFGRNFVNAEENQQLMFYARAAASAMPHLFGPIDGIDGNDNASKFSEIDPKREVLLNIMQPKCDDKPSEYIVTVDELEKFRVELKGAVALAETKGVEAPVAKGKWCDFATCKAVCPLWAGQAAALGEKMARLAELSTDGKTVMAVDKATGESESAFTVLLPDLLDLAEAAQEWTKAIFAAAYNVAEEGTPPEGWRLGVSSTNKREWDATDEEVRKFLKNRRYALDDVAPRKTITMPAAEKLLKKDKKNPIPDDMVTTKTTTKTALVRDDSSLPSPEMSSERASALADKLAALGGSTET